MKMFKKIASGIATATLFVSTFAPGAMAADLEISGNGNNSENKIEIKNECKVDVKQENKTDVGLVIKSSANSGGNQANQNTGGDVTVKAGKAVSVVGVEVQGGNNTATVPSCCDCVDSEPQTQLITGNGNGSDNKIEVENEKETEADQESETELHGYIESKAKSGKNKANKNTGTGELVKSKKAKSVVSVFVKGGKNTLNP